MVIQSVSVIIPNYNGIKLLEKYLPYTFAALEQVEEWELIVVDDCSADDSVAFLKENYPDIVLIQNSENKGFSYTCNRGMEAAKNKYLFFLNSDIKLTPGYFNNQWTVFEDEKTFGVMGKILEMDTEKTEVAAKYAKKVGTKYKISSQFYFQDHDFAPTAFISGANALVDAAKIKQIGGFDEIFSPFYFEDLDLSIRAWRMGWKCYFDNSSICYHLGSCTIKQENLKKGIKEIYFRNRLILHGIHLENFQLKLFYLQTLLLEVLPKTLLGQFWILKSFRFFLKHRSQMGVSRKNLQGQMRLEQSRISFFDTIDRLDQEMKKGEVLWVG